MRSGFTPARRKSLGRELVPGAGTRVRDVEEPGRAVADERGRRFGDIDRVTRRAALVVHDPRAASPRPRGAASSRRSCRPSRRCPTRRTGRRCGSRACPAQPPARGIRRRACSGRRRSPGPAASSSVNGMRASRVEAEDVVGAEVDELRPDRAAGLRQRAHAPGVHRERGIAVRSRPCPRSCTRRSSRARRPAAPTTAAGIASGWLRSMSARVRGTTSPGRRGQRSRPSCPAAPRTANRIKHLHRQKRQHGRQTARVVNLTSTRNYGFLGHEATCRRS